MNNSWNKNSNSAGFVYFNQSPMTSPADTRDFLSFGDSTPSPKSNNRSSPINYGTPPFHSSPRKFNSRNTYRYSRGHQGNRSFTQNSSNTSYYSPYNHSRNSQKFRNEDHNNFSRSSKTDISHYYDHTCMSDPWADLQKELDETMKDEEARNKSAHIGRAENEQEDESMSSEEGSDSEKSDSEVNEMT